MPENIRALIVLLALGTIGFVLLTPAAKNLDLKNEFSRWRNWWFVVTVIAFISGNYWVFFSVIILLLLSYKQPTEILLPLYCFLLLCLPVLTKEIPGFAGINYLFYVTWPKLLAFSILVPLYIKSIKAPRRYSGYLYFDKIVFIYFIYVSMLSFRGTSMTDGLRDILHYFFDIYLPYIVFSRSMTNLEYYKNVFFAFFSSIFLLAIFASFELVKSWQLYTSVKDSLGTTLRHEYKYRSGMLRANVTQGAINVGMFITVAFAFGTYLFNGWKLSRLNVAYILMLLVGILSTLSRGPWVGLAVMVFVYILISADSIKRMFKFGIVLLAAIPLLLMTTFGNEFVKLLPIVGEDTGGTISYRQNLLSTSIEVINENPLTGSADYLLHPKMQTLIQGEGIIDIVNTFLQIAFNYGYIGLGLFLSVFIGISIQLFILIGKLRAFQYHELEMIGIGLLATLASVLVVITTVSTLNYGAVGIFYWSLAGMGVAFIRMATDRIRNHNN